MVVAAIDPLEGSIVVVLAQAWWPSARGCAAANTS
jgi:hypothetical protein